MALDTVLAGIGAIVTAAGGVILIVREFRRRDRRESIEEIEQCEDEVHALRADLLSYRHWAYDLAVTLTDRGIAYPPAPPPVHVIRKEPGDAVRSRARVDEAPDQGAGGVDINRGAGSAGAGRPGGSEG